MGGQSGARDGMADGDGELLEALVGCPAVDVSRRFERAERALDCHLERGRGAHEHEALFVGDRVACGFGERSVSSQPPEQGVGVEEKLHDS
jgi:hypothetical protein